MMEVKQTRYTLSTLVARGLLAVQAIFFTSARLFPHAGNLNNESRTRLADDNLLSYLLLKLWKWLRFSIVYHCTGVT